MPTLPRLAVLTCLVLLGLAADAPAADRISVADPSGGPRWTATQSTRADGRTCVTIRRGRMVKGTRCALLDRRRVYSYVQLIERATDPRRAKSIFFTLLAPNVVRARLQAPGGARTYRRRRGRARVLLAVVAGRVERPTLTVDVRIGTRTQRLVEGPAPAVQVADPLDGPAWRSRTAAASGGSVCIGWERVPPRFEQTPQPERGTPRCGDPDDDVPVAAAERVDGRLVIFGLAGAGVRSAELRTPSGDRTLALEPKTRALLAVLPGETDPASLRVVARLGDGRQVERQLDVVG